MSAGRRPIRLGHISGVYGVRGWVRVFSETDPLDNLLGYSPWRIAGETRALIDGRRHGKGLIARLEGCDDRDAAATLIGEPITVLREQLPPPAADEFYWADLEGLEVETSEGTRLGVVRRLMATGANDVLVVAGERERLLPFVWDDVVLGVDFDTGRIRVRWDPDF